MYLKRKDFPMNQDTLIFRLLFRRTWVSHDMYRHPHKSNQLTIKINS